MLSLACPVCRAPLDRSADGRRLSCAAGHSFDRARQGYWNLLLAQRKRSRDPGDSNEMIQARKRFLDAGYYWLIAEQVNRVLIDQLTGIDAPRVLDLGCGDGYYTAQMEEALKAAGLAVQLCGVDISKHAVRTACRRATEVEWLVATGADLPLPDASLDALTLMFSRVMPEPMARVLKPGALLLVVWPGPDHLIELRRLIYAEVKNRHYDPAEQLLPLFDAVQQDSLEFDIDIDSPEGIRDLLAMTPHGQRISAEARQRLLDKGSLRCHADIRFALFRRRSPL
jgi:23S rRNA (guanine745-N1)-methyltransferase